MKIVASRNDDYQSTSKYHLKWTMTLFCMRRIPQKWVECVPQRILEWITGVFCLFRTGYIFLWNQSPLWQIRYTHVTKILRKNSRKTHHVTHVTHMTVYQKLYYVLNIMSRVSQVSQVTIFLANVEIILSPVCHVR